MVPADIHCTFAVDGDFALKHLWLVRFRRSGSHAVQGGVGQVVPAQHCEQGIGWRYMRCGTNDHYVGYSGMINIECAQQSGGTPRVVLQIAAKCAENLLGFGLKTSVGYVGVQPQQYPGRHAVGGRATDRVRL